MTPQGPAEAGGIESDDVILSINGSDVKNTRDLVRKIADLPPDTVVNLRIVRNHKEQPLAVKLGKYVPR